jgi:cobalt/nickel transport system permease protein
MALPGLAAHYLCRGPARSGRPRTAFWTGAVAGALGIGLGAVLLALALYLSAKQFWSVIQLTLAAHLPVLLAEAFITGSIAAFLARVKPELLAGWNGEVRHASAI